MQLNVPTHLSPQLVQPGSASNTPVNSGPASGLRQITGSGSRVPESDLTACTTWGNGVSLGRVVASAIRLPGRGLVELGKLADNSNSAIARGLGGISKVMGNAIGAASGIAGQAVTLAERALINSLKGLGGLCLTMVGLLPRLFGHTATLDAGVALVKVAWMTRGQSHQPLTAEVATRIGPLAELMANTCSGSAKKLPEGFTALKKDQLPQRWQQDYREPEANNPNGKGMLKTDALSALQVSLSTDSQGTVYVCFKGTDVARPATVLSDALGAFGVADSSFRMARDLVADLSNKYPGKVHVMGHSLGGALAQFAGIKAGVPVSCFNSMGLPAHLCDKLVDLKELGQNSKLQHAKVEHFNSDHDLLSTKAQTRFMPIGLSQLGVRYKVEDGGGHRMGALKEGIQRAQLNALDQSIGQMDEAEHQKSD